MTQYNPFNVKLSNSQLNKLKSTIKNGTEATLNLSSNLIGNSNDEMFLTNPQVLSLHKPFANDSSANTKLSKTQLHKVAQSRGFLGRPSGPLLKISLPLIKNVLKPLAKCVLIQLWLPAAASATDTAIHKRMFGSGATTSIISNEEMNDFMKIVKSLKESGLLIKGGNETI